MKRSHELDDETLASISQHLKKQKQHVQQYQDEYSKMWPCISQSKKGDTHFFCTICCSDLRCKSTDANDVEKHVSTSSHFKCEKLKKEMLSIASFFQNMSKNNDKLDVIRAEAIFVKTLAETNSSMASSDRWNAAFKRMFPDSKLPKNFNAADQRLLLF